jgi:hypothetical protein
VCNGFPPSKKRREFEWCEAMKIVGMARLYQDQHKFDQGVKIYRKAILIARKALMNEEFRQVVNLLASRLGESVHPKDACGAGSGLPQTSAR